MKSGESGSILAPPPGSVSAPSSARAGCPPNGFSDAVVAAPPGYALGNRQGSRRFKLQMGMAADGDDAQKAVARAELAKQLRACELGAMRTHTLLRVQHPLAGKQYTGTSNPADGTPQKAPRPKLRGRHRHSRSFGKLGASLWLSL